MKRKRDKNYIYPTRRQLLGLIGCGSLASLFSNPIDVLINGLANGVIDQANAQSVTTGAEPRKLVNIRLNGGAARWYFDLALNPYNNGSVIRNNHVNTRFTDLGTKAGNPAYSTVSVTRKNVTLQMPHLWSCMIPTSSGVMVPMSTLLDNMMILRGINLGTDGHNAAGLKQTRPHPVDTSLSGLVAEGASSPIPAVALPDVDPNSYRSKKGVALSTLSSWGGSPLGTILSPFQTTGDSLPATYLNRRVAMEQVIQQAMASIAEYAKSGQPGSENLAANRSKAETLLKTAVGDLAGDYTTLKNKYYGLMRAAIDTPIPGVTDKPVLYADQAVAANGLTPTTYVNGGDFIKNPDLRTILNASTEVRFLAENFAVTEYLLKKGYSSNINISISGLMNLFYQNITDDATPTQVRLASSSTGIWYFDEHYGGSTTSLIVNSAIFRSVAACLNELITSLKTGNLFDETVILLGGDFTRTPLNSQIGSDHGWQGNCVSVFSGAIQAPFVVGNIKEGSPTQGYIGTWGEGATIQVDGSNQILTAGHQSSTLCKILRVRSIMTNNSSVVTENAGGVEPTVELAKVKA